MGYIIGGSTGMAFRLGVEKAYKLLCHAGFGAIEISALLRQDLESAVRIAENHSGLATFHLPDREVSRLGDIVSILKSLPDACSGVVHPHLLTSLIRDAGAATAFSFETGSRMRIENLDCRQIAAPFRHNGSVFAGILAALPQAKVCLDVAHALSVERDSCILLKSIETFADRIEEIHLSFFSEENKHLPLSRDHWMWPHAREIIAEILRKKCHLIILETPATTLEAMLHQHDLALEICG